MFEKYAVKSLIDLTGKNYQAFLVDEQQEYDRSILQQLDAIDILWNSESGRLGEATLAIMHGWIPYTIVSNKGFTHVGTAYEDRQRVYDVLPTVLVSHFQSGHLGQTMQDL